MQIIASQIALSAMSLLDEWSRCSEWIDAALLHAHGSHTLQDVLDIVVKGDAQFWPFDDAAIVTEIIRYPQRTTLRFWLAGGNFETLAEAEPKLINWSKQFDCTSVEIVGRRGWVRALDGYEATATIMAKDF